MKEDIAMDEQEFDALFQRPFGVEDAMRAEAQLRRCAALAVALWGRRSGDLHRQLLLPHPEIPTTFALDDFQELQRSAEAISAGLSSGRFSWVSPAGTCPTIFVGSQRFTMWEARCEVVRRAIEYLEGR